MTRSEFAVFQLFCCVGVAADHFTPLTGLPGAVKRPGWIVPVGMESKASTRSSLMTRRDQPRRRLRAVDRTSNELSLFDARLLAIAFLLQSAHTGIP